jgi:putative FmdB family regulatory protein
MFTFMVAELENGGANNMPIYEYKCEVCDEITEEFDKITSTTKTIECSLCGQPSTRIMSLGSFHLKGGGWYKDGYSDKKSMSTEEQIERSTVKTESTNTKTGKKSIVSEKPLDRKEVYSKQEMQERRASENKSTKVTADDFKDKWVGESDGQKVINI